MDIMHRLLILSLTCLCVSATIASAQGMAPQTSPTGAPQLSPGAPDQTTRLESMLIYENGKKDVGVAVILGLLIPGAGDFYAGSPGTGAFLFGAAVAGIVMGVNGDPNGDYILFAAALTSPFSAGMSASGHNRKLKQQLGIAVRPSIESPAVAVICSF